MERSDAEFIRRAKRGDKDAFGVLLDRHRDTVFGICLGRCGNFADAQDLTQEAFLKAYANLSQLRDDDKFAAWLYRIAYAICVDWHRRYPHPSLYLEDIACPCHPSARVEDELFRHETRESVSLSLSRIPEALSTVASLHYLCGYSVSEIADQTGVNLGTVKMRLVRAREKLRTLVDSRIADEIGIMRPGKSFRRKVLAGLASHEKEATFSHMRAIKALLEYHGEKVEWDYLLGASGEAFCAYFSPSWTYHTQFAHSWDVAGAACEAYGYRGNWHLDRSFEDSIAILESSIKAGSPVAAPGINPSVGQRVCSETHFWFLVKGIDREEMKLSLSGVGGQDNMVPFPCARIGGILANGWLGLVRSHAVCRTFAAVNPLFAVEKIGSPPTSHEVALTALRRAADLSVEQSLYYEDTEPASFTSGVDSMRSWAQHLHDTVAFDMAGYRSSELSHCGHYGGVMYSVPRRLETARRAASSFLHSLAETEPDLPADALLEAAGLYESVASAAHQLFELYFDVGLAQAVQRLVSNYPKPEYFYREEIIQLWRSFGELFFDSPGRREFGAEIIDHIASLEAKAATIIRYLPITASRLPDSTAAVSSSVSLL